jgi:hypothetical protein
MKKLVVLILLSMLFSSCATMNQSTVQDPTAKEVPWWHGVLDILGLAAEVAAAGAAK